MWVEFVVDSLLLLREVFPWVLRFSLSSKTNISKFQMPGVVDEEPLCGCATNKLLFVYLFIHSFTDRIPSSFGGSWLLLSFLSGGFGISESRACCGTNTAAIASSVTG